HEASEIELLEVFGAGLKHDLVLVIMTEPVRVFAVAPVGRAPARLDVSGFPRIGSKRAKHGGRVESPGSHLHVIGLEDDAPLRAPVMMEREDQVLEAQAQ